MPAKSKAQFRFMQMIAHNPEKAKKAAPGLSSSEAQEYVDATPSYKNLPEKKGKFSRIRKALSK